MNNLKSSLFSALKGHFNCKNRQRIMRVIGLISGGKDSIYSLMECERLGHSIVALVHLYTSAENEELDSHMFQTVGHSLVTHGIAKCIDPSIPFVQRCIKGSHIQKELTYYSAVKDDEVEDLYLAVKDALEITKGSADAICSGAILSNYQRLRVENVAERLGLISFAPLWRRNQGMLLEEMITSGIDAILIKTATYGLIPREHLGRSIRELKEGVLDQLLGGNSCGEGGEYESLVLDCPLFKKKKIKVKKIDFVGERLDSEWDPSGHILITDFELVDKECTMLSHPSMSSKKDSPIKSTHITSQISDCSEKYSIPEELRFDDVEKYQFSNLNEIRSFSSMSGLNFITGYSDDPKELFSLIAKKMSLNGAITVGLLIHDMKTFRETNVEYIKNLFHANPPSRACVQANIPGITTSMDVIYLSDEKTSLLSKSCLHVQSISSWAPASIGPYSQAVEIKPIGLLFLSGMIPLDPISMTMLHPESVIEQFNVCMEHISSVLKVVEDPLHEILDSPNQSLAFARSVFLGVFCDPSCKNDLVQHIISLLYNRKFSLDNTQILVIGMPKLPKAALVEVQLTGLNSKAAHPLISTMMENRDSMENSLQPSILKYSSEDDIFHFESFISGASTVDLQKSSWSGIFQKHFREISSSCAQGEIFSFRVYYSSRLPRVHFENSFLKELSSVPSLQGLTASFIPTESLNLISTANSFQNSGTSLLFVSHILKLRTKSTD